MCRHFFSHEARVPVSRRAAAPLAFRRHRVAEGLSRTIADRVAIWIRQRILRGEMDPGMLLREARIARDLHTSRAPVREAISQLVQEGWATKRANQSARIVAPTATRLREAATLRGVLEGYAARLAIDRIDAEGLARLRELVRGLRDAVNRRDLSRAFELDFAFHDAVVRASGHQLLYEMWKRMGGQIRFMVSGTGVMDRDPQRTVKLHDRILAAFEKRDGARAAALLGIDPRDVEQLVARIALASSTAPSRQRRHAGLRTSADGTSARSHKPITKRKRT